MFTRLFVLVLLALATVSVSTPAHASTLTVNWVDCAFQGYYNYTEMTCFASASGGTGSYVSYTWFVDSSQGDYTAVTSTDYLVRTCYSGYESLRVTVTVRDSAGATASRSTIRYTCGWTP